MKSFGMSWTDLQAYKKSVKITQEQEDLIIGTLLGDATISLRNNKPGKLIKFEQGSKRQAYLYHLYDVMKPFCSQAPMERTINPLGMIKRYSFWFKTFAHDSFLFYFNMFYTIGLDAKGNVRSTKHVPNNIHKFLTARALAYWFMDDGSKQDNSIVLHTQGFTKPECVVLQEALASVHNIRVSIHKDKTYWKLFIPVGFQKQFIDLISPFLVFQQDKIEM